MSAIKSISVYKTDYMQPSSLGESEKGNLSSQTFFNEAGKIIEEISYLPDGKIEHRTTFLYDAAGNLIEEHLFGVENEFEEKRSYEYDNNGKIINEFFYYLDETFDTIKYSYNDLGKLVEKQTIDSDNEPENKEVFEYQGELPVSDVMYDAEENVLSETLYKHDDLSQVIEVVKTNNIEDTFSRTEMDYNEKGIRTETRVFNSNDELIARDTFTENDKGLVIGIVEEDQYSKNTIEIKYDDNGNMIEQIETNDQGELNHKIERLFDADNNLIEHNVMMDKHGKGLNQNITLYYRYEFFA